jgi:hypothetical protein
LQNDNGIYKANLWEEWKLFSALATELQLDVVCMTETNLNLNTKLEHCTQSLAQKSTKNAAFLHPLTQPLGLDTINVAEHLQQYYPMQLGASLPR